jgi:hypothetical protein
MYRKEHMSKKLNDKLLQSISGHSAAPSRPRLPKTRKLLRRFEERYRNEMPISYKEQLKESELNLEKIKRNDKIKFEVSGEHCKSLYQPGVGRQEGEGKRFLSLRTGQPQKERFVFQSLREIIQGRLHEESRGSTIDIKNLENTIDSYVSQCMRYVRPSRETERKASMAGSPVKLKFAASASRRLPGARPRSHSNVERSFSRSEETSKRMIDTMSSFYETKHEKKRSFDRMCSNLRYDRPLTSSVRRRNYAVLGQ